MFADFSGTIPFDEGAVFASDAATAAMGHFTLLFWYAAGAGEVAFADSAVHAAWRDEVGGEFDLGAHNCYCGQAI